MNWDRSRAVLAVLSVFLLIFASTLVPGITAVPTLGLGPDGEGLGYGQPADANAMPPVGDATGESAGGEGGGESPGSGEGSVSGDGPQGEESEDDDQGEDSDGNATTDGEHTPTDSPEGTDDGDSSGQNESEGTSGTSGSSSGGSGGGETGLGLSASQTSIGGNLTLSDEPVMTVQAERPEYWRTGAFGQYTGSGWRRSSSTGGTLQPNGGEPLEQVVVPFRAMQRLPAAWRPVRVGNSAEDRLQVTERLGLRVDPALEPNGSYRVVSRVRSPSPADLEATGDVYPEAVEPYTQLQTAVPDRVSDKTAEITASASSNYERAAAIERWLKTNKKYSLNAPQPEGDVVDAFLFEREQGYCEYFATSMVVMLRTQDVPARYVTGYSPGTPQDDGTYLVRSLNAHAWVEVYFEDIGWVRFDPTPGSERIDTESAAVENPSPGAGTEPQIGSPAADSKSEGSDSGDSDAFGGNETSDGTNETDDSQTDEEQSGESDGSDSSEDESEGSDDSDSQSDDSGSEDDTNETTAPINVSIAPDPVPGRTVTVSVTRGSSPVPGVTVFFNGESIGQTNESGDVAGAVPYEGELTVTIDTGQSAATLRGPGEGLPAGTVRTRIGTPAARSIEGPRAMVQAGSRPASNGTADSERTYSLPTNLSVTLNGSLEPGETVTLLAAIEGVPVEDALVMRDGSDVGRTDANGTLAVQVPYKPEVTYSVQRGAVNGNTTATIRSEFAIDVGARVPGQETRLTVTLNGDPLPDATVAIEGDRVGTTDDDGNVSGTVPIAGEMTVTVARGELGASRTVNISHPVEVTVDGQPLPFREVTLTATVAGEPLSGATVKRGNETVATLGPNGKAEVGLPLGWSAAYTVEYRGLQGTTTVDGILLLPLAAVAGLLALLFVGLLHRRYGFGSMGAGLADTVHRALRRGVAGLVVAATIAVRLLDETVATLFDGLTWARVRLRRLAAASRRRVRRFLLQVRGLAEQVRAIPGLIEHRLRMVISDPPTLRAIVVALLTRVRSLRDTSGSPADGARSGIDVAEVTEASTDDTGRIDVHEAWETMVGRIRVRNPDSTTPREFAGAAREAGLPSEPVEQLTDVFREVRYGERPQTDSRRTRAREALDRIEHGGREA